MSGDDIATLRIGLIGYGEVGGIFGAALAARGVRDPRVRPPAGRRVAWQRVALPARHADHVDIAPSAGAAVADADLVICAVTASATRAATASVAGALKPGAFLLDINSASPTDQDRVRRDGAGRGRPLRRGGVMTSVPPYGLRVPMLLGGPEAAAALPALAALGFLRRASPRRRCGVASAHQDVPQRDHQGHGSHRDRELPDGAPLWRREGRCSRRWRKRFRASTGKSSGRTSGSASSSTASGARKRCARHAATVREAGLEPFMASAIADRQAWVAALAAGGAFADVPRDCGLAHVRGSHSARGAPAWDRAGLRTGDRSKPKACAACPTSRRAARGVGHQRAARFSSTP